ncbi:hypothetical protein ACFSTC_57990 [Nonomuraea ferruginea]
MRLVPSLASSVPCRSAMMLSWSSTPSWTWSWVGTGVLAYATAIMPKTPADSTTKLATTSFQLGRNLRHLGRSPPPFGGPSGGSDGPPGPPPLLRARRGASLTIVSWLLRALVSCSGARRREPAARLRPGWPGAPGC